ncbi:2-dehydro-3-deoxy-6-phosphogalactonate aldolase [Amylibacter marinus]|uniref:2-dehydro-3-deoxy-6-phosphogalactonate aldolase n=1 Tax=Amylibacter marinus TaxID=1475483 RepID=A0ABQ5VY26_9RHOB|nr:2-dehydro-3-deoxy-6-phosphogalactonate aldolase [Amylibacter marinus]GLQ36175.1 2-dehydro-3-deoxy-6-phosphogalactonate aldolase [Amylibacter marinus]
MTETIIAILRGVRPEEVEAIGEAILKEGISTIEVPLNSPEALRSISKLVNAFGADAKIGAGTVLSRHDVKAVAEVGGQIIVSPDCNPDVIGETKLAGLESYPGVATMTECFTALRHGADGLKLFPSSVIGIDGFKAFSAVLPTGTQCYAVGGAGPDNFANWIRAGIAGFGIGTAIYAPNDRAEDVQAKARRIVEAYNVALQECSLG